MILLGWELPVVFLGYADNDVNKAIISGLNKGSMATLNATEEIDLAKNFINS